MKQTNETLNQIMSELADKLNISETMEQRAVSGYQNVGSWLDSDDFDTKTEIYPQGSFALGTVVKPLNGDDEDHEYDIDLVCYMPELVNDSAQRIKQCVGERLREHKGHQTRLDEEGRRCWTLHYAGFHMDILPATAPLDELDETYLGSIRITDKDPEGSYSFRLSNPSGYKAWFEERMGDTLLEERSRVATKITCSIDDVELYQTRTTLQKVVQILKHHRNLMFEDDPDVAPISIILTTLAAQAYDGSTGVFDALQHILQHMEDFIYQEDGVWRIDNPVTPDENFADKWEEDPAKARAFFAWLDAAQNGLVNSLINVHGLDKVAAALEESLGDVYPRRALEAFGTSLNEARKSKGLYASAAGLTTVPSTAARVVPDHSFFGKAQ